MKDKEIKHIDVSLRELIELEDDDPFIYIYKDYKDVYDEMIKDSESLAYNLNKFNFFTIRELHNDLMTILSKNIHSSDDEIDFSYSINDDEITIEYSFTETFQEQKYPLEPPENIEYPMTLAVSFKTLPEELSKRDIKSFKDIGYLPIINSSIKAKSEIRDFSND